MRRLDESLSRLAERGERVGADVLLDRVDQRLAVGIDPVVVALDPRRTDMQTQQGSQQAGSPKRGPWIAAAAFGVAITIAVAAVVTIQLTAEDMPVSGQPPGALKDFVAALHTADTEAALAVVDGPDLEFVPWVIALNASGVEFRDCATAGVRGRVQCTVSMGPDFFHSRIAGHPLLTTFTAVVREDRLSNTSWPTPAGLVEAEAEFEAWVLEVYPDRYDDMFVDPSTIAHVRFGEESSAARSELLEEFLASR
jgi:hypothetical protein